MRGRYNLNKKKKHTRHNKAFAHHSLQHARFSRAQNPKIFTPSCCPHQSDFQGPKLLKCIKMCAPSCSPNQSPDRLGARVLALSRAQNPKTSIHLAFRLLSARPEATCCLQSFYRLVAETQVHVPNFAGARSNLSQREKTRHGTSTLLKLKCASLLSLGGLYSRATQLQAKAGSNRPLNRARWVLTCRQHVLMAQKACLRGCLWSAEC